MSQHHASANQKHFLQRNASRLLVGVLGMLWAAGSAAHSQQGVNENLSLKVQQLTEAMSQTQKRLDESQHEMEQMRAQLATLQQQIAQGHAAEADSSAALSFPPQ